jgi:uncharacterized integral membrane protein
LRILNTVLAFVFALLAILFAVSNRAEVDITLWPFPFQATMGLWLAILLALVLGILIGLIAAWLAAAPRRRERKRLRGQVKDLEQNLLKAQTGPRL